MSLCTVGEDYEILQNKIPITEVEFKVQSQTSKFFCLREIIDRLKIDGLNNIVFMIADKIEKNQIDVETIKIIGNNAKIISFCLNQCFVDYKEGLGIIGVD